MSLRSYGLNFIFPLYNLHELYSYRHWGRVRVVEYIERQKLNNKIKCGVIIYANIECKQVTMGYNWLYNIYN